MGLFENIKELISLKKEISKLKSQIDVLSQSISEKATIHNTIIDKTKAAQEECDRSANKRNDLVQLELEAQAKLLEVTKKVENQKNRISRGTLFLKSVKNAVENFALSGVDNSDVLFDESKLLNPTFEIKPHSVGLRDLRKQFNENNKIIDDLLSTYKARYTTKANASIYNLLVIALKSELQNCIYTLKYNKLDKSISGIQEMSRKYLAIVAEGNQQIAPTITRFIGQIEMLFIEAIKIEYEYYVLQERIKEEQKAIREQMRQEAEERKILEQQKKQLEAEAQKYQIEIARLVSQLEIEPDLDKRSVIEAKLLEINALISNLEEKKEEITKLQNGQAGHVYIISNIGSFGENMFKIGMTRRLQPEDRINELGDASVPFSFDVHALIWSDDAVALENALHKKFENNRVNKINLRKEFFRVSVDELQGFVNEVHPTAAFETTMLAEQFRQSIAIEQGIIDIDSLDINVNASQDDIELEIDTINE